MKVLRYKYKKIIILSIIFIISIVVLLLIFNKKYYMTCSLLNENNTFEITNVIDIEYNRKIKKYSLSYNIKYSEGYMSSLVDKYDSVKNYLKIIDKIDGVDTKVEQNNYNINYDIVIDINKISDSDYNLLELSDIVKLKKRNIKQYFLDKGYTCK